MLGTQPHSVGDVVLRNDEILAGVIAAADENVAVGVAGVEMIDRDPIQSRAQIRLHLPHHVAREAAQIGQPIAVLWR